MSLSLDPQDFTQEYDDDDDVLPTQQLSEVDTMTSLVKGFDDQVIAIEMNDINQQVIMKSMIRAIQRMNSLLPESEKDKKRPMPTWLAQLNQRLANVNNKRNTRLFTLRLLLNQPVTTIVAPWSQELLPAILKCCLEDLCNSDSVGDGFHYLLKDVVFALTNTWKTAKPTSEIYSNAGRFTSYLLKVAYDDESEIFKENRLAVCHLLSLWLSHDTTIDFAESLNNLPAPTFKINLDALVELLQAEKAPTGGAYAKASSKGSIAVRHLQRAFELLLGIVRSGYNFISYRESNGSGAVNMILKYSLDHINYPRKEVFEYASQVCGMALSLLKSIPGDVQFMSQFKDEIEAAVSKKYSGKSGYNAAATSIYSIVSLHPEFLTRKLFLEMLPRFGSLEARTKYEFLSACANPKSCRIDFDGLDIPEAFSSFLPSLLGDFTTVYVSELKKSVPMIQIQTLKILRKFALELKLNVIELMLTQRSNSSSSTDAFSFVISERANVVVRKEVLLILLANYTHFTQFILIFPNIRHLVYY